MSGQSIDNMVEAQVRPPLQEQLLRDDAVEGNARNDILQKDDDVAKESEASGKSNLLKRIEQLKAEQKQLREEKKKCASEIKNAMRKKRRLQRRAGQLSDEDLMEVWRMRVDKRLAEQESGGDQVN